METPSGIVMATAPVLPVRGTASSAGPKYFRLPDANRAEWTRDALAVAYPNYRDLSEWSAFRQASVELAERYLPAEMQSALREFFAPHGDPAIVLENLPVDPQLPEIPESGLRPANKQSVSEVVITGMLCQRGELLSFVNEKNGSPIHEVVPVTGMEAIQSNSGRVKFGFHSDNAFLPSWFKQQGILLYGLFNEKTATTVVTAEQILQAAPEELANLLAQPIFRHACPASFSFGQAQALSAPCPILWRDEKGILRVSAASSTIVPTTSDGALALELFRSLLDELEPARVVVRPGTALLFKDDRVLHGRDAFNGPRWLQRAYFTDSLDLLRDVTGSDGRAFSFDARALVSGRERA
jgi:alpha-ketoglutarate-dependent taurine dioxygenase